MSWYYLYLQVIVLPQPNKAPMKLILILCTLSFCVLSAFGKDTGKLYPISKGNLWGYIDKTGTTVIRPQFYSAGQFSEGLAPVRVNGTYGYIDQTGTVVISPAYDLALLFYDGQAKVFLDGKPYFIDKKGAITFQHTYQDISSFDHHSFAIATTQSGKYGVINRRGALIVDTVFQKINPFNDGLAVVEGLAHLPYPTDTTQVEKFEVGVIDTTGKWIVPYGRYSAIHDFQNNYSKVTLLRKPTPNKIRSTLPVDNEFLSSKQYLDSLITYFESQNDEPIEYAIIDNRGNQRFIIQEQNYNFNFKYQGFHEDLAVVSIYLPSIDSLKSRERTQYKGIINSDGKIVLSDTGWKEISPFSYNRAFVLDSKGNWKMIDKSGKQIGALVYEEVVYGPEYSASPRNPFEDGIAFVKLPEGWCMIDTMGKILSQPKSLRGIHYDEITRRGDMMFIIEYIGGPNSRYSSNYGFFDPKRTIFVAPRFIHIDINNFDNDLIYAMKDERKCYILNTGKIIWQEDSATTTPTELNIDYMYRGYYYVTSRDNKELEVIGSWFRSYSNSDSITLESKGNNHSLHMVLNPEKSTIWLEKYSGMELVVANTSTDTLYFAAQDSRLYLKIQAQNKNGEWKDIEYLPSSWCGNSYHTLFLAPNEQWKFAAPVYHGEFKTKLRAQLLYLKDKKQKTDNVIYSNEIEGTFNPGQFFNRREYFPGGLMDPYNE